MRRMCIIGIDVFLGSVRMLCVLWKKRRIGLYIWICAILVMSGLPVLQGQAEEMKKEEKIYCVAFGDSIAKGYAGKKKEDLQSYPWLIADAVTEETEIPTEYVNYAKNGLTSARLNSDVLSTEEAAASLEKADIITLTIGANDLMQEFKLTVREILETDQRFTSAYDAFDALQEGIEENPLLVMRVLGMLEDWDYAAFEEQWAAAMETISQYRKDGSQLVVTDIYNPVNQFELPGTMNMVVDEVIQNMNQVMYDHAEEYDYHVVNLFESEICEHTQRDGLHPDQEGQRLIAGLAMEKIDTGRFMGEPEKEIEKTEPARKSIGRTILGNIRKVILLTTAAAVILIAGGIAVWRKRRKKTNTPDN